jgi:hypothetical protein
MAPEPEASPIAIDTDSVYPVGAHKVSPPAPSATIGHTSSPDAPPGAP